MPANTADPGLSRDEVAQAASALLGRTVTDLSFSAEPVDPELRLHSVTAGVLRVRGSAAGENFSLVVKQTHSAPDADPAALWGSGAAQSHHHYWKREWLAYSSGLLDELPGRLRAPRLLLATEPAPDAAWFWLEDVAGRPGARWDLGQYARAGHDLGTTQGAFAAGRPPMPDHPWLSRGWLADWVATTTRSWPLVEDDLAWRDERLADLAVLRDRARDVWAGRWRLQAVIDAAAATLVHLDFWPNNLISAPDGRTVAIDWSSVGVGAVGQDLDQMTLDPVWMQIMPGVDLLRLEETVLTAYASGLRAAGHEVTDAELRRCYAAAAGLRYTSMLPAQAQLAADPDKVATVESRWGRPFAAVAGDRARVIARSLDLAEEVLAWSS